jgi:hypothetical protein
MARVSVDAAKAVISSLLSEQERDRENLQRMIAHSEKMIAHLQVMRDEEERRVDAEAAERKQAIRTMFAQLITVEEERSERLNMHIQDLEGAKILSDATPAPAPARKAQAANT